MRTVTRTIMNNGSNKVFKGACCFGCFALGRGWPWVGLLFALHVKFFMDMKESG